MDTLDLYNKREMKNLQVRVVRVILLTRPNRVLQAYIADRDKAIKVMGKSSRKLYGKQQ